MLFGDPQLALTAVGRVLDITADEVQQVAKARLRPDNRAVLVYEPVTADEPEETSAEGASDEATATTAATESTEADQ